MQYFAHTYKGIRYVFLMVENLIFRRVTDQTLDLPVYTTSQHCIVGLPAIEDRFLYFVWVKKVSWPRSLDIDEDEGMDEKEDMNEQGGEVE